jgi:hypothetical protein
MFRRASNGINPFLFFGDAWAVFALPLSLGRVRLEEYVGYVTCVGTQGFQTPFFPQDQSMEMSNCYSLQPSEPAGVYLFCLCYSLKGEVDN